MPPCPSTSPALAAPNGISNELERSISSESGLQLLPVTPESSPVPKP